MATAVQVKTVTLNISWKGGNKVVESVARTESAIWKEIGKVLPDLKFCLPNRMVINSEIGKAELELIQRGTYSYKGQELPSMYVTVTSNKIDVEPSEDYKEMIMTCVNVDSNQYKFYKFMPDNNLHKLRVSWGRIGDESPCEIRVPYPSYLYWIRYYEKISKGYIDQTAIKMRAEKKVEGKKAEKSGAEKSGRPVDIELYNLLYGYAREQVHRVFNVGNSDIDDVITPQQVMKAKQIYREMSQRKTVNGFNRQMALLLPLVPRHVRDVSTWMAKSVGDFEGILAREDDNIKALEAMILGKTETEGKGKGTFEGMGIDVYKATKEQTEQVISKLSDELKGKVKAVYRVIPRKQKVVFEAYIKEKGITEIRQFWHGSRNCNWLSIVKNGLSLNPDAEITGKMFGNGIYFAPSSMKSWGYTSYRGSYWARGTSGVGIMGLYATAYGEPKYVSCAGHWTQRELDRIGKNCVHAKAGKQLRNDEVIYYSEKAMLLNYIVIFG